MYSLKTGLIGVVVNPPVLSVGALDNVETGNSTVSVARLLSGRGGAVLVW